MIYNTRASLQWTALTQPMPKKHVALMLYDPSKRHSQLAPALITIDRFEVEHFSPGTSEYDEFQIKVDSWHGLSLLIFTFPVQYLAKFSEMLSVDKLRLVKGLPTLTRDRQTVRYVPETLFRQLGVTVDDRTYTFDVVKPTTVPRNALQVL